MVPLSVSLHICTNDLWTTLPPGRFGFSASLPSYWMIRKCILFCCHSFIHWTNVDSAPSTCQGFSQAGGTAVNTGSLFESHPCLVPLLPWEWFSSEPSSSQLQNAGKYNLPKRWLWKLAMLARVQWWDPGGVLGALSKCWCLNPTPLSSTSSFHAIGFGFRWGDSTFHSCAWVPRQLLFHWKEERLVVGSWSLPLVRSHLNPAFILRQELWPQHTVWTPSFYTEVRGFDGRRLGWAVANSASRSAAALSLSSISLYERISSNHLRNGRLLLFFFFFCFRSFIKKFKDYL